MSIFNHSYEGLSKTSNHNLMQFMLFLIQLVLYVSAMYLFIIGVASGEFYGVFLVVAAPALVTIAEILDSKYGD